MTPSPSLLTFLSANTWMQILTATQRVRDAWLIFTRFCLTCSHTLLLLAASIPNFDTTALASPADEAKPPNVLVLLCDDLGVGDVGAFNPQSKIATPHLDELAKQGLRLTDCHSGSSVCTPTRYGILCGRYAWRTALQQGVLGGLSPSLIADTQLTIPKLLKQKGYRSACVGKWHLGLDWKRVEGKSISPLSIETEDQNWNVHYDQPFSGGPLAAGFDEFFGISGSLDMVPYTFLRDDRVDVVPTMDRSFDMTIGSKRQTRRGPAASDFHADQVLPELTKASLQFLERHRDAHPNRPFFLYVAFASPHTPIIPQADWIGKSKISPYADFVMQQDEAIGQILDKLDQLNLSENTMVVFTSDNGCSPEADFEQLRKLGHDPSNGRRGAKADIFEGGHLVPTIVRWPAMIQAGQIAKQTTCLTDIFATVAEAASLAIPLDQAPDSYSWLPIFRDPSISKVRDTIVHHSINGTFAIRCEDYKLIFAPDSGGWSPPRPIALSKSEQDIQLYNLREDPKESSNLSEIEAVQVKKLSRIMESLIDKGRSTAGPPLTNDVPVKLYRYAKRRD
jgi:arylsulfatase A